MAKFRLADLTQRAFFPALRPDIGSDGPWRSRLSGL